MAERSGFFPYVEGDTNSEYDNAFLAKWVASFISNGVYMDDLAVTAGENMQAVVPAGQAWINGYYYRNDGDLLLNIANADGVLNRKDTVVLRWDINERSITVQVLAGTPANSPTAPVITRSVEQYDLKLAEISIPAGTTAITQALITDTRLDNSVCGIVTGVVQQVATATFYQQIQSDLANFKSDSEAGFTSWSDQQKTSFQAWVEGIKGILGPDEAANLLNLINGLAGDGRTTETVKGNADTITAHAARTDNPHQVTAAQVGALPASTTHLPNPAALTMSKGYGGQTGTYDGSAAKTISIPQITISASEPGTLSAGDLWGVY